MANQLTKDLEIMFETFVESYDDNCVISKEADKSFPSTVDMQRAGDTFYVQQDYEVGIVTGLDISASGTTDAIQRMIPTVFRAPDNVRYAFDAKELRDTDHMTRMGKASSERLSFEVDKNIYQAAVANANIVVKKVGAFAWDDGALAEALMISRGINSTDKKLFLNAFDYLSVAKDLGNRAYIGDYSKDAYARAQVPDIAGFKTFRTGNQSLLAAAGTVSGITVSGAQSYTPTSMTGDVPTDNRKMTLVVAGANLTNTKLGDAFTIAGINAVHQGDKSDTGQLQTFRVVGGAGTANLQVSPPIIATGPYQNCSGGAGAGAAITFLNNASKASNVFWSQGAVTLDYGKLAFPSDQGAKIMTATTKQGVPLLMSAAFNHLTAKTDVRCTTMYAATVRDPAKCGIIIANQT